MERTADGGREALQAGELLTVRVRRWDPAAEPAPRWETYQVPYAPRMRILDALESINALGHDLAYQWYCGARRCGLCAMVVNGQPRLTCWEPAERAMTIEPLGNLPLRRDLVVDRTPYETLLQSLDPRLQRAGPYPGFPEPLPDLEAVNRLSDCIECLVCHAACPVIAAGDPTFAGPAALVQLGRFVFDVRDGRDPAAIPLSEAQAAHCQACRACEPNCPAGIPIVPAAIEPLRARARAAGRP